MKLKYVINEKNKIILANSLQDIANYSNITIDSLKYSIKHNKLNVNKINVKLKDIVNMYPTYEIDSHGIVTINTNNNVAPEELHKKNVDVK